MFKLLRQASDDLLWPAVFILFVWLVYLSNITYDLGLNNYGIHPRSLKGLLGVVFSPFLHGGFGHLFSNTIPFVVSAGFLFHFYKEHSWKLIGLMWFFSGFPVWLYGEVYSNHIGASGLVYGQVFFLLASGLIRKNQSLSAVAMLLVFLYGSMVWGLLPQFSHDFVNISWEGHLSGAVTGVVLAFVYRKYGPEDDLSDIHEDEDEEEELPDWWIEQHNTQGEENPTIRYHYTEKKDNQE
jgi:membrane associated rhomboid family serine protease